MKRILLGTVLVAAGIGFAATAVAADGAAIYKSKCSMCHGADGQGTVMGNSFKGNEFVLSGSDKEITALILNGRSTAEKKYRQYAMGMPAVKLDDAEVSAVVKHIKSLASE